MGVLVVKRYPVQGLADVADHTYVECGTGAQGWSCWGGKTGGTELRRGDGSTLRADQIAGANERGGITCYLINGVCHQAANRILLPASITVRGARGDQVSEALFGTYGRPSGVLGLCRAPFDQHTGTTGDLSCLHQHHGGEVSSATRPQLATDHDGDKRTPVSPARTRDLPKGAGSVCECGQGQATPS